VFSWAGTQDSSSLVQKVMFFFHIHFVLSIRQPVLSNCSQGLPDALFPVENGHVGAGKSHTGGYLGSTPDPGCEFPAFKGPKITGERYKIILFDEYDESDL